MNWTNIIDWFSYIYFGFVLIFLGPGMIVFGFEFKKVDEEDSIYSLCFFVGGMVSLFDLMLIYYFCKRGFRIIKENDI